MKKYLCILFTGAIFCSQVWALENNQIKADSLVKSDSSWDGSQLPEYPKGQPEITIMKIVIPPKTDLPIHEHPVINAGVLLKGELTVVTEDNKTLHLKAGEALVEVMKKWHYGKNEGSEPAEIIVFYAGTKGTPITVKKDEKK